MARPANLHPNPLSGVSEDYPEIEDDWEPEHAPEDDEIEAQLWAQEVETRP